MDKWAFNNFWTSLTVLIKVKWWLEWILQSQVTGKKGREQLPKQDKAYCKFKKMTFGPAPAAFWGWEGAVLQPAWIRLALDGILVPSTTLRCELMYLQMLCNTLKAISLPSVSKARESLEAEVINCECTASQGMVSQTEGQWRQDSPEQLPSQCHSGEGFFKDFFKDYCYYFRQIFCGFVNIVKPLREFGEKETISVAGTVWFNVFKNVF